MSAVLVTGGSGYVGTTLVTTLLGEAALPRATRPVRNVRRHVTTARELDNRQLGHARTRPIIPGIGAPEDRKLRVPRITRITPGRWDTEGAIFARF
jgi:nucleoside-diphosphate-sugar epimerase